MGMYPTPQEDRYERQLQGDLTPPYAGALYTNRRSGIVWQVYGMDEGKPLLLLRREKKLTGGTRGFMFCSVSLAQLERNWNYVGATPRGHYLWGYELATPEDLPSWHPASEKP